MKKKAAALILAVLLCLSVPAANNYANLTSGISQISLVKKYKNVSIISLNKYKNVSMRLTQEDKYVIIKYVMGAVKGENTFLLTNCYLRGNLNKYLSPKDITKPLQCRLKFYADSLANTVSKAKLPQNTILYYSMDDKEFSSVFADKGLGNINSKTVNEENLTYIKSKLLNKEYTEKGFLLTNYDARNISKTKYRFQINAPKNLQAVLVDEVIGKETKQILINSGYKWKISDISVHSDNDTQYYSFVLKLVL